MYSIILSAILALMMFVASAWAYFHRGDLVIKKDSVPIATYNGVLDLMLFLATNMTLSLGVGFFCVGYLVLKAYCRFRALPAKL